MVNLYAYVRILIIMALTTITFEGQTHQFPADFSDDEIAAALGPAKPQAVIPSFEQEAADAGALESKASADWHKINFSEATTYAAANEGGYANDPNDPGGETNFGISKRQYPDVDIRGLTQEKANEIYQRDYWDKTKLGDLNRRMGVKVFDAGVNIGAERAVRFLQEILGVTEAGVVNNDTVAAATAESEPSLLKKYAARLKKYYKEVAKARPSSKKYLKGWVDRADRQPELGTNLEEE